MLKTTIGLAISSILIFTISASAQAPVTAEQFRLLPGYAITSENGIDSAIGVISKKNGIIIHYDIGESAGDYTQCQHCNWTAGELWRREQIIGGKRFTVVLTRRKRVVVSCPEFNANFYADVRSDQDLIDMLFIVLTYNPG